MLRPARLPRKSTQFVSCQGGLDQVTPYSDVKPGTLRKALNYEIDINGGYTSIQGFEQYDGQASPSDGTYHIMEVTISGSFSVGDTVTGGTSGETAVVLAVVTTETPNYLVVTKVSGTFTVDEDLEVSSVVEGTLDAAEFENGASTAYLHAIYTNLAADEYRGDITTASGISRGIFILNDVAYAVVSLAGNLLMKKESASGWTTVSFGNELSFTSGGTTEIAEGDTIDGLLSGASADVDRVVLTSGSWAGGDAAGKFILSNQSGTFQAEGVEVSGSGDLATIAGDSTAITLSSTNVEAVQTVKHNFGGEAGETRVYAADGVNRGWEFDGSILVPIDTGMTTDAPVNVTVHKNHLFFSYDGSAQHSGTATPYIWSPIFGAAELAVGDTITAFQEQPGSTGDGALVIFSRNSTHVLYGNDSSDWQLVKYRNEVGAFPYSVQDVGFLINLDDRGVINFSMTQAYGNFRHSVLSDLIDPYLQEKGYTVIGSCIVRNKNQYRLFFSDNTALYITIEKGKVVGMMPVTFTFSSAITITAVVSEELSDGTEKILFGAGNDVYELDKGTSFDGLFITNYLFFHYVHSKAPTLNKRYIDTTVYMTNRGYALCNFEGALDYSDAISTSPVITNSEFEVTTNDLWFPGN